MYLPTLGDSLPRRPDSDTSLSLPPGINKLHPDVLGLILCEVSTASQGVPPSTPSTSSMHPLIVATHVSRSWRHLALTTPSLWSRIGIRTPSVPLVSSEGHLTKWATQMQKIPDMMRTWLDRSQGCSISLHIRICACLIYMNIPHNIHQTVSPCFDSILDLACSTAGRWKQASIHVWLDKPDLERCTTGLRGLKGDDVPLLESLHLNLRDGTFSCNQLPIRGGIHAGTSVSSLRIPFTVGTWEEYDAPWGRLTHLEVAGFARGRGFGKGDAFGPKEALELMSVCGELIVCKLWVWGEGVWTAGGGDVSGTLDPAVCEGMVVKMVKLRVLALSGATLSAETLNLPSLCDLQLFSSNLSYASLRLWMEECGRSLTSVRFGLREGVEEKEVREVLSLLPSVEELKIATPGERRSEANCGAMVVRALTLERTCEEAAPENRLFCPKLRTIYYMQQAHIPDDTILDFVASRRGRLCSASTDISLSMRGIALIEDVQIWSDGMVGGNRDLVPELRTRNVDTAGLEVKKWFATSGLSTDFISQ